MDFSKNINLLRLHKELSQQSLAKKLNVHQTAISQWETGRTMPDISMLQQLSDFFSVTMDELLGTTDVPLEPWKIKDKNKDSDNVKPVTDTDIKFALFGAPADEITDAMMDDVKKYAQFIRERKESERKKE